jgi:hypothetical protein
MNYVYLLIFAVRLASGDTGTTDIGIYTSEDACTAGAHELSQKAFKDESVDQYTWTCAALDWDSIKSKQNPDHVLSSDRDASLQK